MKILMRLLLALPLISLALASHADDGQPKLPTVRLNVGIYNIQAEVAQTPEEREIGLMSRKYMGRTTECSSPSNNPESNVSG